MSRQMICFDIDGTLRDNVNHEVSASTLEALKTLKKDGHTLVVSTGRAYDSLKLTQIRELIDWDGYVLNNGQLILDGQEKIIKKHVMDPIAVQQTLALGEKLNMCVTLKKKHRIISKEPDQYVIATQRYFNNAMPEVGVYDGKEEVEAMLLYGPHGYDYEPFTHIRGIHVMPGMASYADVSIAGISKATGNLELGKALGFEDYIAFGDSQNDLEMFRYAKLSICMGQGDEKAKRLSDYITTSIEEKGIYHACQHFQWFKEEKYD